MCGRFINITEEKKIKKIFNISKIKKFSEKSYNISPQQNINVLFLDEGDMKLDSIKSPGIHAAYSEWIEMYASNEFQELSKWMNDLVNKTAKECTELQKQKMKTTYINSCKFELDFWSSSLDKTRWNI